MQIAAAKSGENFLEKYAKLVTEQARRNQSDGTDKIVSVCSTLLEKLQRYMLRLLIC